MKTYDNQGRLISEMETHRLKDGRVITTTTVYDGNSGRATYQHVSIRDSQGRVTTQDVFGKIMP